ncbi:site-specific integrase [Sulfuricella sp.]|uniref:tyrosine-type recombinase/integrase n=1 Tax=Sulfuricella sp. TaxID=2099377 RepID=UPI002BCAEEC9|nr:site-specific integrase [Sulfuricella sp.]HUX62206.1 site-specific integrase [Sulfuricella sp.]
MATIRKKGECQWHVQIRRKGFPSQTKTLDSRSEAEAWARDIESKMDKGIFVSMAEAESTTLYGALERYEREVSTKKKGRDQEKYRIQSWQANALAIRSLASLRGADFAKYRDERLAAGAAAATVRLDLALISHVFTIAVKEWNIPVQNPVANIRLPRQNNARERRLSEEEVCFLLAAVDDPGDATKAKECDRRNIYMPALVRVAIESAMRQGEMLALTWANVDLSSRVAKLPDTKNGTVRNVPLSPAAVNAIKGLPRAIGGRVFATTASAVKQSWARAITRAQRNYLADCKTNDREPVAGFLEDMTFHDLRHEGTSRLAEIFPLHKLMKITGHKDTRMLARYYHPRAEDMAEEMAQKWG